VSTGRAYVAAYVEFVHYTERIHEAIVETVNASEERHAAATHRAGHEP
jgi:hypothetical protein